MMKAIMHKDFLKKRNKKIIETWNKLKKQMWNNKQIINVIREKYKITERQIYNILKFTEI
jgi:Mor family transcriptional regulator